MNDRVTSPESVFIHLNKDTAFYEGFRRPEKQI